MKESSLHAWITKHYLLSDNQFGEMTKIIENELGILLSKPILVTFCFT